MTIISPAVLGNTIKPIFQDAANNLLLADGSSFLLRSDNSTTFTIAPNGATENLQTVTSAGGIESTDLFYSLKPGTPDEDYKLTQSEYEGLAKTKVLLATVCGSGDAALEFVDGTNGVVFDATYDSYQLDLYNLKPTSDNSNVYLQVTRNSGTSWDGGGADYSWATTEVHADTGLTNRYDGAHDRVLLGSDGGVAAGEGANGKVLIFNPASTSTNTVFGFEMTYSEQDASESEYVLGTSVRLTTSAVNGVRFEFGGANVSAGVAKLYGIV